MDNLNNIPNVGNWGDAASKLNDNFNKIKQAVTTVENTSKNNKGYFTSLSALNTAFPSPKAGQTAYVYDEASSTKYYIYNAVDGAWVATSVEAPSVGVDLEGYTKTGGSTKTTKEVDDELAQLASKIYTPLIQDERYSGIIDCFYGTKSMKNAIIRPIQITKSSGRIICHANDVITLQSDYLGDKTGIKLVKVGSISNNIWLLIDWDRVSDVYDTNQLETFSTIPRTSQIQTFVSMLLNGDYKTKNITQYDSSGLPLIINCVWSDGTEGVVTYSNLDENVIEFKDCVATYGDFTITYGTITYDDMGNILTQDTSTIQ